jgi:hypothetical protein
MGGIGIYCHFINFSTINIPELLREESPEAYVNKLIGEVPS